MTMSATTKATDLLSRLSMPSRPSAECVSPPPSLPTSQGAQLPPLSPAPRTPSRPTKQTSPTVRPIIAKRGVPPPPEDRQNLVLCLLSAGGEPFAIEGVLRGAFPHLDTDAGAGSKSRAEILASYVAARLAGSTVHGWCLTTGLRWADLECMRRSNPGVGHMLMDVEEVAEGVRHCRNLHAAETRAEEGWDEPVFWRGVQVGTVRRFDNRLLERMLASRDPARFGQAARQGDGGIQVNGGIQVHFHIEGVRRGASPAEIDAEESALWRGPGDTKTIQGEAEDAETEGN